MKGKITEHGALMIDRMGDLKNMACPFYASNYDDREKSCGDWCPHFSEPKEHIHGLEYKLEICHGKTLIFESLTDERSDV